MITEIVKKFGVHSCIFQSTAADQYQGGGAKISPPPGPDRVKVNSVLIQISVPLE